MELIINCFYFTLIIIISLIEFNINITELPKDEFINSIIVFDCLLVYRNRIRSIDFICLNSFMFNIINYFITDLIVAIGSIDVVFNEVDR